MTNTFRYGTISKYWVMGRIYEWVDVSFRKFVDANLLTWSNENQ